MNILMLTSEMAPFAKTGGLGDVLGALPRSLAALGEDVRVVVPLYPRSWEGGVGPTKAAQSVRLPFRRRTEVVDILEWTVPEGPTVYFVAKDEYFDREGLYGTPEGDFPDNAERFTCLTLAGLEVCRLVGWTPDIVHVHDWPTALAPAYLKSRYAHDPLLGDARSVCTIHNLAYQGVFPGESFGSTELPGEFYSPEGFEHYGRVNFLKGGILFSDRVTTVSERYCREIRTPEFGCGLDGLLRRVSGKLCGILNGVDYTEWDPRRDPNLPIPYDADHLENKRRGRAVLLADCGLPDGGSPVIGMVTRLSEQKGIDLVADAIDRLMSMDLSLIVLGTGERRYEEMFRGVARRFPDKAAVFTKFDNVLAHRIEAGADMFLMPSRYEPCGLNQVYSLRYGTVPIVRATGGLDDTIEAFDPKTGRGNGFKFEAYTPEALLAAVREAVTCFADPPLWGTLMKNGMSAHFGWEGPARKYREVYRRARAT